jgi:Uri superfamily endonuclease
MEKGVYAIVLRLRDALLYSVGALGPHRLPQGWYVYVGSAHGPGGLAARLNRHNSGAKRLHWHVDYLRAVADWTEAWTASRASEHECAWAQRLMNSTGASVPVPGFGASDCRCKSHLIHFECMLSFHDIQRALTHGDIVAVRWNGEDGADAQH